MANSTLSPPPPSEDKLKSLLRKFGDVGTAVVNIGVDIEDDEDRFVFFKSELIRLTQAVKQKDIYGERGPPVDFQTFRS